MMRHHRLFLTSLILLGMSSVALAQPKEAKNFAPNAELMKTIDAFQKEMNSSLLSVPQNHALRSEIEVYAKAGQWMTKHSEWLAKNTAQQTYEVLVRGIQRAATVNQDAIPWRDPKLKPLQVRAYRSKIDGSIQPYGIQYPKDFDPKKKYRLDVVLHGRDGTLTEVKFIHAREFAKEPKLTDYFVLEVYGRGNNAYRWAGETDVFEAIENFGMTNVDPQQIVLRGFSMGGAGTWHLGLHHPFQFRVMGPGAGFSTTRTYIKNFPIQPDYIEPSLNIYDAVKYAQNNFHIPVVAYSGSIDPQKAAADNIEAALKNWQEPHQLTHIVAPGLAHKLPPEWFAKCDAQYRKELNDRPAFAKRIRFVTYTPKYGDAGWLQVTALEKLYEQAVIDAEWGEQAITIKTQNVRQLEFRPGERNYPKTIKMNDSKPILLTQEVTKPVIITQVNGQWQLGDTDQMIKRRDLQGPIDDAFMSGFVVVPSVEDAALPSFPQKRFTDFEKLWDKYFRSNLPIKKDDELKDEIANKHLVLFGNPGTNTTIALCTGFSKLPFRWSQQSFTVGNQEYSNNDYTLTFIYPNPMNPKKYVVFNSGHTFGEADLKGTNALLYPRLGDWAVLDNTGKVVRAGYFDQDWKYAGE